MTLRRREVIHMAFGSEVKRYPLNIPMELYTRFGRACGRAYKSKCEVMRDLISKYCLIDESVEIYPEIKVQDRIEQSAGLVARSYHIVKDWWHNDKNHNG